MFKEHQTALARLMVGERAPALPYTRVAWVANTTTIYVNTAGRAASDSFSLGLDLSFAGVSENCKLTLV